MNSRTIKIKSALGITAVIACAGLFFNHSDLSQPSLPSGKTDFSSQISGSVTERTVEAQRKLIDSHRERSQAHTSELMSELKPVQNLARKVLKSNSERIDYERALSDSNLILKAASLLSDIAVSTEDLHKNETARMAAMDYLDQALTWKANPNREEVGTALVSLITSDFVDGIEDVRTRKSFAADRIEAYIALKRGAPEFIVELQIEKLPKEGRLYRLIQYAEKQLRESNQAAATRS